MRHDLVYGQAHDRSEEVRSTMHEQPPNEAPVSGDHDSGPHNVRFTPQAPVWPVRVDMKNEPENLPPGVGPAPPESLLNGCVLAEVDNMTEDIAYAAPAAGELVAALGL